MRRVVTLLMLALGVCMTASAQPISPATANASARYLVQKRARKALQALEAYQEGHRPAPLAPASSAARTEEEANLTKTGDAESEIHAAINPADTNNLVASAIKWQTGGLIPTMKLPIYYTKDFGETWQQSAFDATAGLELLEIIAGGGDPVFAFTPNGRAYFTWLLLTINLLTQDTRLALYGAYSDDGGATWTAYDEPLDEGMIEGIVTETPSGRLVDKQWLAADQSASAFAGNAYMAYAEINAADSVAYYQILVKTLRAGQPAFRPAVVAASSDDFLFTQFPTLDVGSDGTVHLLFTGVRKDEEVASLYYSRSADGGATFGTPHRITNINLSCFPPGSAEESCIEGVDANRTYPSAYIVTDKSEGAHDGNLYVVWSADGVEEKATEGFDIYYSRSTDGGTTWSAAQVLNQDAEAATHNFYPSATTTAAGELIIAWYDRRDATEAAAATTHYYLVSSTDGGATFGKEVQVTTQSTDFSQVGSKNEKFGIGEYNATVATAHYAMPFWADGRENDGNLEIYFARVALAGDVATPVREFRSLSGIDLTGPSPNPAGGTTTLTIDLEKATTLSLELYDGTGRHVRTLRQASTTPLPAGEHRFDLPLTGLPAGLYQLKVETYNGRVVRPLVVR